MFKAVFLGMTAFLASVVIANAKPLFDKPIYNEETKSYFELVDGTHFNNRQGLSWRGALAEAEKRNFNGVQGRLAKIPSAQTELFLRVNLRLEHNTWFGAYYDCGAKNMFWVTGEPFQRNSYANWHPVTWFRGHEGSFCATSSSQDPRMPTYLAMADDDKNWALQLPFKRYYHYIVEYPTGGRGNSGAKASAAPAGAQTAAQNPNQ